MIELQAKILFDPKDVTKKHSAQSSWKYTVMALTQDDVAEYYAWFLLKRFNLVLNPSIRGSHITIINDRISEKNKAHKQKYLKAKEEFNYSDITFKYDPALIRSNGTHWWISTESEQIAAIRTAAGFDPVPYFKPHLTLGYANEKNLAHSNYILEQILKFNL